MNADERKLYGDLYDITQQNMKNAGNEIPFTKEAFLYSAKRDLQTVDMFDMLEFDKETFLQALYIGFLFRTPEEKARKDWENAKFVTVEDYQKHVFQSLSSSPEALKNNVVVTNNKYAEPIMKMGLLQQAATVPKNKYVDKAYAYYKRLPTPIKKVLKKLLKG